MPNDAKEKEEQIAALSSFEFSSFPWFYQTSFTTPGGNETTTNSVLTDDSLDYIRMEMLLRGGLYLAVCHEA